MNNFREKLFNITSIIWLILLFIAPLKLASITGLPEMASTFTMTPMEMLIINWPAMLFIPISASLLLLTVFTASYSAANRKVLLYSLSWFALPFVAMLGAINASTKDFVYIQIVYISGLGAFAMASSIILQSKPELKHIAAGVITTSTVIVCLLGIQQYFGGMQDTIDFIKMRQLYYGAQSSGDPGAINCFLADKRIFSTFSLPNSLAGYLLLTGPLCMYSCLCGCNRIEPVKTSRLIFLPIMAAILLTTFVMTRSRAAILCLGATVALFLMLYPLSLKFRIAIITFFVACFIGGIIFISLSHRGFSSIETRLDYYLVCLKIFLKHPLTGTGWGDFFHDYMKLKSIYHHEAPHTPHNFILSFASQTGICGLLLSGVILIYPIWNKIRNKLFEKNSITSIFTFKNCALFGLTAWTLHSMLDLNLQIAPSAGYAALFGIMLLSPERVEKKNEFKINKKILFAGIPIIAATGILILISSIILLRNEFEYSKLRDLCIPTGKTREEQAAMTPEAVRIQLMKTIKVMPYSPFPWETAGMYMFCTGDLYSAQQFMQKAAELSPERASFYFQLYRIKKLLGAKKDAEKNLMKARELFPQNPKYFKDTTSQD